MRQVYSALLTQPHQHPRRLQMNPQFQHRRRCTMQLRKHPAQRMHVIVHPLHPALKPPPHYFGIVALGIAFSNRRHDRRRRLYGRHFPFKIIQRASIMARKTVRQSTICLVTLTATPAPDLYAGRVFARISAVALHRTTIVQSFCASRRRCIAPGFFGNILLSGQFGLVSKLHWPLTARRVDTRGPLFCR